MMLLATETSARSPPQLEDSPFLSFFLWGRRVDVLCWGDYGSLRCISKFSSHGEKFAVES